MARDRFLSIELCWLLAPLKSRRNAEEEI